MLRQTPVRFALQGHLTALATWREGDALAARGVAEARDTGQVSIAGLTKHRIWRALRVTLHAALDQAGHAAEERLALEGAVAPLPGRAEPVTTAVVAGGVDGARAEVERLAGTVWPLLPGAPAAIPAAVRSFAVEPRGAVREFATSLPGAQHEGPDLTPTGDAAGLQLRAGAGLVHAGVPSLAARRTSASLARRPAKEPVGALLGLPAGVPGSCTLGNTLAGGTTDRAITGGNGWIAFPLPRAARPAYGDEGPAAVALGSELGTVALDAIARVTAGATESGVWMEQLVHLATIGELKDFCIVVPEHRLERIAARVAHRLDALLLRFAVHRDDAAPKLPTDGALALSADLVDARLELRAVHLPALNALAALGLHRCGAERGQRSP